MGRIISASTLYALCILGVMAQEVSFQASTDVDRIDKGAIFNISFTLHNAPGDKFKAPDLTSFRVISGPSRSFRSTSINGKLIQSISFTYSLQALREGDFIIQPASIEVSGKILFSNPISLKVTKSSSITDPGTSQESQEQVFFQMETDSTELYIGQQVVVNYKIYTLTDIENIEILFESSYAGCFTQTLDTYNESTKREEINGVEYRTRIIRKVAVFPQHKGIIKIEPAVIRVGIPDQSSIFRSLFSSFNLKSENLTSNELELSVSSPYEQAPLLFSGAVGDFEVDFSLEPLTITTDEALRMRMRVRGDGDMKMVRPPIWDFDEVWEVYDPRVIREQTVNSMDSLVGEKIVEYLIIAREPGQYSLSPQFIYFHPATRSFIEVSDTFSIAVEAGRNYGMASDEDAPLAFDPFDDEVTIVHQTKLRRERKRWMQDPFSWLLLFSPVSIWIMSALIKINKNTLPKERDLYQYTLDQVHDTQIFVDRDDAEGFYSSIARHIKNYVCLRLSQDPALFQRSIVLDKMTEAGVSTDSIKKFNEILDVCNSVLYSGYYNHMDMRAFLADAEHLIVRLEHDLGNDQVVSG